jgi:hypothetical protein
MTFGGKHPFDFGYRGVGISSSGNTPAAFSGAKAQALGHGHGDEDGAGINLNSFLAHKILTL